LSKRQKHEATGDPQQVTQPPAQQQLTQIPAQPTTTEERKPTTEELLAQIQAQMAAMQAENKKSIDLMAQAIVKLNEKIEAKASNPAASDPLVTLAQVLQPKTTSLEDFAKQAHAFAIAADALEHFRHPSRIGAGEAFLMRLGVRAGYPRYMTKAELDRVERQMGIWEALEGEEGEEHVRE